MALQCVNQIIVHEVEAKHDPVLNLDIYAHPVVQCIDLQIQGCKSEHCTFDLGQFLARTHFVWVLSGVPRPIVWCFLALMSLSVKDLVTSK